MHSVTKYETFLDAVFPYARDHLAYPDLIEEGFQPHKVKEMLFWASEDINYRSDITDTFDLKVEALRCHQSQMQELEVPNPEGWLRQRCKDIAKDDNFELGEAFHRVDIEDVRDIIDAKPNILVLGKGKPGMMKSTPSLGEFLKQNDIDLIEEKTSKAIKTFNRLFKQSKNVCAGFHLTC